MEQAYQSEAALFTRLAACTGMVVLIWGACGPMPPGAHVWYGESGQLGRELHIRSLIEGQLRHSHCACKFTIAEDIVNPDYTLLRLVREAVVTV